MTLRTRVRDFAYRRVGGTVVVLVYHRVADLPTDPQLLAVATARFEEHSRMLAERFTVLPLAEVADGLARGQLPRNAVAITFDDGYADNLHNAAPTLQRHGLPATVFVSSGYATSGREYWWDELERIVLLPGTLPERIDLAAGTERFSVALSDALSFSKPEAAMWAGWDVASEPPTARHRLYLELAGFLRPLDAALREQALEALRSLAGTAPEPRSTHLPLSREEVAALVALPGLDVGGHTVNHVRLAGLPASAQLDEVARDRKWLTEVLGHEPRTFAYPFGAYGDFTADSEAAVRAAGYEIACANFPRPVKPWTRPYQVPRFLVRNWEAERLASFVQRWLEGPGASGESSS